jgi:hypothetical protein
VRSAAYFDGGGAGSAIAVLSAYALGGLLLTLIGRRGLAADRAPEAVEQVTLPGLVPAA